MSYQGYQFNSIQFNIFNVKFFTGVANRYKYKK